MDRLSRHGDGNHFQFYFSELAISVKVIRGSHFTQKLGVAYASEYVQSLHKEAGTGLLQTIDLVKTVC